MARSISTSVADSERSVALSLLFALRPGQWTKNLLVFAGLLFGLRLFEPPAVAQAVAAFAVFCALSGVVYLINDIFDRESDRLHPIKALRPIASGALSVPTATGAAVILGAIALTGAAALGRPFFAVAAAYLAPSRSAWRSGTGCSSVRFSSRSSSRSPSAGTRSRCWPEARPITGRFSANTVRICSIR